MASSVASTPTSVSSWAPIRRERIVQRQRIEIAAPFVEQIAGDGGEARPIGRIGRRSERHEEHRADHRHFAVLDCPRAQTVPERLTPDVGK